MLLNTETKKEYLLVSSAYYVGLPRYYWDGLSYPIYDCNGILRCTCYDPDTADNLCELLNHRDVVDEFELDELRDEVDSLQEEVNGLYDQLGDLQKDYNKLYGENDALRLKVEELEKVIERARDGNLFPTFD